MKLPRNTLIWCVLIVCLTLLIFTYLTRKSLCEIRYRDTNREVAVWTCLKRLYEGVTGLPVAPFSFLTRPHA